MFCLLKIYMLISLLWRQWYLEMGPWGVLRTGSLLLPFSAASVHVFSGLLLWAYGNAERHRGSGCCRKCLHFMVARKREREGMETQSALEVCFYSQWSGYSEEGGRKITWAQRFESSLGNRDTWPKQNKSECRSGRARKEAKPLHVSQPEHRLGREEEPPSPVSNQLIGRNCIVWLTLPT